MQNNEIWDGEEFSSLVVIPLELDGTRADAALSKLTDQSRSAIERLMEGGQIFRGEIPDKAGKLTKKDKVKAGDAKSIQLIRTSEHMKSMVGGSLEEARVKIEQNRKNVEVAMENLQSLTRINDMANQILEIASQTNLLSLKNFHNYKQKHLQNCQKEYILNLTFIIAI